MKIYQSDKVTELSYINLLAGLQSDIETDDSMPSEIKQEAKNHIYSLYKILNAYSY